jgi:integrase
METATKHWQGHLAGLFERAGLRGITPHSFRHTFARAILGQAGKTLQDVADALGDTLTVVQRHYAGRSEERTARTNEAIRSTWANDPTLKRARTQKHGAHKLVSFGARRKKEFQRASGVCSGYTEKQ